MLWLLWMGWSEVDGWVMVVDVDADADADADRFCGGVVVALYSL